MIDKPLNQITFTDIDQFVQEKWPEGKTVDYKRDAYGNRDEDRRNSSRTYLRSPTPKAATS